MFFVYMVTWLYMVSKYLLFVKFNHMNANKTYGLHGIINNLFLKSMGLRKPAHTCFHITMFLSALVNVNSFNYISV